MWLFDGTSSRRRGNLIATQTCSRKCCATPIFTQSAEVLSEGIERIVWSDDEEVQNLPVVTLW